MANKPNPRDIVADQTYTTLSGITVYKGETLREAQARLDQFNLWRGVYGSPEYGGWGTDPADGVRKPRPEFKEVAR